MRFHKLRIRLANWLVGTGIEWDFTGEVINSPYYQLCRKMNEIKDIDLPPIRRPMSLHWQNQYMVLSKEITALNNACRRKNKQIENLKLQVKEERKKALQEAADKFLEIYKKENISTIQYNSGPVMDNIKAAHNGNCARMKYFLMEWINANSIGKLEGK